MSNAELDKVFSSEEKLCPHRGCGMFPSCRIKRGWWKCCSVYNNYQTEQTEQVETVETVEMAD